MTSRHGAAYNRYLEQQTLGYDMRVLAKAILVLCTLLTPWAAGDVGVSSETLAPVSEGRTVVSKVAVIPIHGDIDYGLQKSLQRRVETALAEGARVLIFEMDTYGGGLDPGAEMGNFIVALKARGDGKIKTVAYVDKKAISAGALIALACQEIVMRQGTTLGDCQAIMISPQTQLMEPAPEKVQSMVRALMRNYAQSNGYPEVLCEAMVDPDIEVHRVKLRDGQVRYLTAHQIEELKPEEKQGIEKRLVKAKGKLLTLSDTEAREYGISRASVKDLDEAVALYVAPGAPRMRYETNWSEELVRFLNSMAVASLLMIVGMLSLYMAFKTPGFGAPEAVAICCFAILFLSKYLVGLATVGEVLLFAAGVVLVAVEIFLIPGFGVVGIAGVACILVALVLALQKFTIPHYDFEFAILVKNLFAVFGSLLVATAAFMAIVRFLPKTPFLRKLVLAHEQKPEVGYVVASAERRDLVGKSGIALSSLRPAGRAEIEGQTMQVMTDGEFIDSGTRIVVAEVSGNRIVVRKA